jgi:hypothetical protein
MHSVATPSVNLQDTLAGVMPRALPTRYAAPLAAFRILGNALFIIAILLLNTAGDLGSYAMYAILGIMVAWSPEAAFKALAICYLGLMINTFFVPKTLVWTPGRIVLPFLALARFGLESASYRLSLLNKPSYLSLLLFGAVMAVCSLVSGWFTHIALLKIVYFMAFVTLIFTATSVLRHRRADLGEWTVSLILAATLFGVAAVALNVDRNFRALKTDVYEIIYGPQFNGAFVHPNSHAVYGTLFVTFLAMVWLLSRYRQRWLVVPMLACWAAFIARSESRTAFLASGFGLLMLVLYAKPIRSRFGWQFRPNLKRRTLVGLGVLAVILGLFWNAATGNSLGKALVSYIVKGSINEFDYESQVSVDRIVSSRRGLAEVSLQNFQANPLFGIGFGVAKTEAFRQVATYLTAPAEKGFLPTAILEEGGLLGTAAFVLFVWVFSRDLRRDRNIMGLIMFWTFLVTNLGEVTIFAPGGAGSFGWIMIGAAMILNDRCWTQPASPRPASDVPGRLP